MWVPFLSVNNDEPMSANIKARAYHSNVASSDETQRTLGVH